MELLKRLDNFKNYKKKNRRFGLEIEYVGLPLDQSANIIADALECDKKRTHKTHYTFEHPELGEFILELDVELAQKISANAQNTPLNDMSINKAIDSFLPEMLSGIAPSELVTPPLEMKDLAITSKIVKDLRNGGAQGTSESFLYAFGYHVNPEARSLDAEDILRILQSFTLLFDYLVDTLQMDLTRKISGYAAPYPKAFAKHILNPNYNPDIDTLMRDYIKFAPSRNYALDMLPLFSFIDEDFIESKCPDSLIKTRPTYHFRLPNCKINDTDWDIYNGIKAWALVEAVADEPKLLERLSCEYLKINNKIMNKMTSRWREHVKEILKIKGLS